MLNKILGWVSLFALVGVLIRLIGSDDGYHCQSTLEGDGMWLSPGVGRHQPPRNWQPKQCILRQFDAQTVADCLANETALFVGDSHAREAFWAVVRSIEPSYDYSKIEKHQNINVDLVGVKLRFIWDPYFRKDGVAKLGDIVSNEDEDAPRYKMVHMSVGSWYMQNAKTLEEGYSGWKQALNRINEIVKIQDKSSRRLIEFFTIAPIPLPHYETLKKNDDYSHVKGLDATYLTKMNIHLDNYFNKNPHRKTRISVPLSFDHMRVKTGVSAYKKDGIHFHDDVYKTMSDTLLNVRCNQELLDDKYIANYGPVYPFSETCCVHYKQPRAMGQVLILGVICALLPIIYLGQRYTQSDMYARFVRYVSWPVPAIHDESLLTACVVVGGALAYSFFCDRTQFFGKGAKQFITGEFWGLVALFLGSYGFSFTSQADTTFLNRHQTEEWKGWMQIIILIYHITGASKVLSIYKFVRLLVAAYLFMTGYGHACFFIKKSDFSLRRAASVLFRMNFLSILLAYVMDTDYLFYYFAPLVSFWFCVVWVTFRVFPSWNSIDTSVGPVLCKIVVSCVVLNALVRFELPFKLLFSLLNHVFNIHWSLHEWRFRLILDIYIVYIGMIVAVATLRYQQGDFPLKKLVTNRLVLGVASVLFSVIYVAVASSLGVKQNYNKVHPYISWLPILGFVILRNFTARLRSYYSTYMAFIGTCSLETFTLQFHFFLAADTRGRLYILDTPTNSGPWGLLLKHLNFVLVTIIFIIVSHAVAEQSGVLTRLFVGQPEQQLPHQEHHIQEEIDMDMGAPEAAPTPKPKSRVSTFLKNNVLPVKIAVAFALMWIFNVMP